MQREVLRESKGQSGQKVLMAASGYNWNREGGCQALAGSRTGTRACCLSVLVAHLHNIWRRQPTCRGAATCTRLACQLHWKNAG